MPTDATIAKRHPNMPPVERICERCGVLFLVPSHKLRTRPGRFCSRQCAIESSKNTAERFWQRVDKGGECWLWTGSRLPSGYGLTGYRGKHWITSRLAYTLAFGAIPEKMIVCHRCDTPPCCNPNHLFLGTDASNWADCVAKGRHAHGDRSGPRLHPKSMVRPREKSIFYLRPELGVHRGESNGMRRHPERVPRGEKNGHAKLTWEIVREIRARDVGAYGARAALAKEFQVSSSAIYAILHRLTWRDE